MTTLFDPIQIGAVTCPNRIFMSPLTRSRATREHVPTKIMADYYAQRASVGLIIAEPAGISQQGLGWPYAAGIWTKEQIEAWSLIPKAVHDAGGRIFLQLWHMGRMAHSSMVGGQTVSASATKPPEGPYTYDGDKEPEQARALETAEVKAVVEDYRRAAAAAMSAGFDGLHLHGGNGYLPDQFLRDGTNFRTDEYGGSIENRMRFLLEVVGAMASEAGGDRVAVRLSPNDISQGCDDSNPAALFPAVTEALNQFNLAFLEMRASRPGATTYNPKSPVRVPTRDLAPAMRKIFKGKVVLNQDYGLEDANQAIASGQCDAITYGRKMIANPDLPRRYQLGAPLNEDDPKTWNTQGPEGYTDYPFLDEAVV